MVHENIGKAEVEDLWELGSRLGIRTITPIIRWLLNYEKDIRNSLYKCPNCGKQSSLEQQNFAQLGDLLRKRMERRDGSGNQG